MTPLHLRRTDPARNMRRFYRLDVQPDLFFIREWGRIRRAGQVRMVPYATAGEAHEALAAQRRMKERRGYLVSRSRVLGPSPTWRLRRSFPTVVSAP
jgi:predicted DNA-binding WGR domain protein